MLGLRDDPGRAAALAELHARPSAPVGTGRRMVIVSLMGGAEETARVRAILDAFCRGAGGPPPAADARHHRAVIDGVGYRWELHNEFSTFTVDWQAAGASPDDPTPRAFLSRFADCGPAVLALDVMILGAADTPRLTDPSAVVSEIADGAARIVTDFRADARGMVRIDVIVTTADQRVIGAATQQAVEIVSYTILSLLGLEAARASGADLQRLEGEVAGLAATLAPNRTIEADREFLRRLIALSGEIEASVAQTAFRFAATHAYGAIVWDRLDSLKEHSVAGAMSWRRFLDRRLKPALRTTRAFADRQTELLARVRRLAELVRTSVDIAVQEQNRDLLDAMNKRGRIQLRLQQTVEGLSVAALSYYALGLLLYPLKALKARGLMGFEPEVAAGIAAPFVLAAMWLVIRRIRGSHGD